MAVGDVVNQVWSGLGYKTYQPAAGVEVMISSVMDYNNTSTAFGLYNGSQYAKFMEGTTTNERLNTTNTKIFINNTNYFRIYANTFAGFTGIQIK